MVDRLAILKIHFPLDRPATKSRRDDCLDAIRSRRKTLRDQGITSVLLTDHNTHSGMPAWGGRALFADGLDYIGVSTAPEGASISVLSKKKVRGTIDGHDFIGAKCRVVWPSGETTIQWFVQANLGRGVSPETFEKNALRIKHAFPRDFVIGLDEIDEADRPDEHQILSDIWSPRENHLAGWGTLSPVIVSPCLTVRKVKITQACKGLAKVTPNRDLVEVIVSP